MNVVEFYRSIICEESVSADFNLFEYRDGFYVGKDSSNYLCVVIKSSNYYRSPIIQRTRLLSIECNIRLQYCIDGNREENVVHIVRCYSQVEKEKEMFLELIDSTILGATSDDEIIDTFQILAKFFANKSEPSDSELIGLFAELDAIRVFSSSIQLERYWQSQDRMKFDFSITDTLKLEVKATTKNFRTHHFRHEQLVTDMYDIYVLSYMLRYDDEGQSLLELIHLVKPLLVNNMKKLLRVETVLKNVSEQRLDSFRFNREYTQTKRHIYPAETIPKFSETTPDGVANAEYDCNLDNLAFIDDSAFISIVHSAEEEE